MRKSNAILYTELLCLINHHVCNYPYTRYKGNNTRSHECFYSISGTGFVKLRFFGYSLKAECAVKNLSERRIQVIPYMSFYFR
ncbi:hypothetical protein [Lacinutrix sp. 5H-3-7-4]|uniref:hypothetical protein n=1 Tax=Lacinutrix sp. (strain 5H-3-7-4) TaxID=983544 RepID=UPI0002114554|nr:hypothetical protein [Lacinutrix sp. 5H-3-7-4]AEH02659.1 hypothetical protein Lacal_2820 [Lacinutrix sp. 5H-3-7-4]AEH02661.1 hypothetical protein Lacal_2822 [Lacinutrix sp. 5H-3-7-4]AEH02705.1 hypothetical protein Lacal_2867 [Lacinutrix sp. 5H-3-7-4]AEH02708.1 hypothetical protein Lacal_2870 [Lacinutrix sp. 5H-3-7-4]AEH02710.1 hypothetical protein Lacal_2872 [Lacinutrix sp. 5H-3-7-4]